MKSVVLMLVLAIVASACTSPADAPDLASVPPAGVSDAAAAWCVDFANFPAIAKAAIAEKVDGYEALAAEQERIVDKLGDAFLDNFLGGYLELEWRPDHEAAYAQACTAAFDAR